MILEKKKIRLEDIMPVIEEKLASGGTVEIPITGTSMLPLLYEGRDTVTLSAVNRKLKKYDLPLYRRKSGAYILHRVIRAADGVYNMCGDNQWIIENKIDHSQIIGLVTSIKRNGKSFSVNSRRYKLYCTVWNMLLPFRKYIVRFRGKLNK